MMAMTIFYFADNIVSIDSVVDLVQIKINHLHAKSYQFRKNQQNMGQLLQNRVIEMIESSTLGNAELFTVGKVVEAEGDTNFCDELGIELCLTDWCLVGNWVCCDEGKSLSV